MINKFISIVVLMLLTNTLFMNFNWYIETAWITKKCIEIITIIVAIELIIENSKK